MKKTYDELYFLRGLAIIGVVVCHQIYFLHSSNWVNCFTIYSVPMLIFCAGITKIFSINRYIKKKNSNKENYTWMSYTYSSLKPIVVSYAFCCIIYGVYYKLWNGYSFHKLLVLIVEFNLSAPFYFMKYYIVLAILAPILYFAIRMIGKWGGVKGIIVGIGLVIVLWMIGYIFRVAFSALGGSYLSIYGFGMLVGMYYDDLIQWIAKGKWIVLICWLVSIWLACNTFWAVIHENISEIIGIDSFIEYTINPPNFGVTLYAVMTAAMFGYLYGYSVLKKIRLCRGIKIMGKYSLDIYLWHILIQNLYVRLNSVVHLNMWLLRIVAYVTMFGIPIAGRYLYGIIKKKGTLILEENQSTE